ncbi:MAG: TPM domain-containing protein [Desulfatiglandaceae bacterium]|jgi:uncharacterized protein
MAIRYSKKGCILKSTFVAFFVMVLFLVASTVCAERPFPKPMGLVNDFGEVISTAYRQKIGAVANEVLKKTGTAIVIVTMPDIGGAEYNDYANRLYSAWGIGKKGEDKGVLIFVAVKERKMRIETGYGAEGILPDGLVGEIRDTYMIPALRKNRFGEGIFNGTVAIARVIAKNAGVTLTGTSGTSPPAKKGRSRFTFLPLLILFIVFMFLPRRRGASWLFFLPFFLGGGRGFGSGGTGGSFGGFGGGFGGFGGGMSGGGGAGGGF